MFNFTRCKPGTFQPRAGQTKCLPCRLDIYANHGLRSLLYVPLALCDVRGLRTAVTPCPAGRYCLEGTKTTDVYSYSRTDRNDQYPWSENMWLRHSESGVVTFNRTSRYWPFYEREAPATGIGRAEYPPDLHTCAGRRCVRGSVDLIAEQPFPCPLGHFCRPGVATDIAVPKNFSTPQRCYGGFFCPRGSETPEGKGPCPAGYYCPSQTLAIQCPIGQYCPGVGNVKPLECYPGTYNPIKEQSNCTICPTGHICPGWGRTVPEICPAGFVCVALGLSAPVLLCPEGYYCPEGTLTLDPSDPTNLRPLPCPPGTFCLGGVAHNITVAWVPSEYIGATAPQHCTEGAFCRAATPSAFGTGQCYKGHYCPPGSSYPTEVPKGSYAGKEGGVVSTLCIPGDYAPLTATTMLALPCGPQLRRLWHIFTTSV